MWIWIICLVVLIVCFIVALRMLINSYDVIPADKKFRLFNSFTPSEISYHMESIPALRSKIRSLEDKTDYFQSQLEKINNKLKLDEKNGTMKKVATPIPAFASDEIEEDWKELFYEENEKKEKLENALDVAEQEIEYLQAELEKVKQGGQTEHHKNLESSANGIADMQQSIEDLARQLMAATTENQRLQQQLHAAAVDKENHSTMASENEALKQENQTLQSRLTELEAGRSGTDVTEQVVEMESSIAQLKKERSEQQLALEQLLHSREKLLSKLNQEEAQRVKLQEDAASAAALRDENRVLTERIQTLTERQAGLDDRERAFSEVRNRISELEEESQRMRVTLEEKTRREAELQQQLTHESAQRNRLEEAANHLVTLRSENEGYRRQIAEMAARQSEIEGRLLHLKELEQKVMAFEQEKSKMISNLEQLLQQSKPGNS